MRKRILLSIFSILSALSLLVGVFVVWQPDSLRKQVLDFVARQISESTPYRVTVGEVSGNVFTGITLQNVRLVRKADQEELVRSKMLRLSLDGWALFHKQIVVRRMDWNEPTIHVEINPHRGRASSVKTPHPLGVSIEHVTIENGQFILRNGSRSSATEITLKDIALDAQLISEKINIRTLQATLDEATMRLKGDILLFPEAAAHLVIEDKKLPLERLLSAVFRVPPGLRVVHSGRWNISKDSGGLTLGMTGKLAESPVDLRLALDAGGSYQSQLRWSDVSLARLQGVPGFQKGTLSCSWDLSGKGWRPSGSAHVTSAFPSSQSLPAESSRADITLTRGVGDFQVTVGTGNVKTVVSGKINLPRRSLQGQARLVVPDLSMDGILNASLWLTGKGAHPDVNGFVTGKFPNLTVKPLGLTVKDVDLDIRASNQRVEVRRFTGKTKKGVIQMTGTSQGPHLAYSLKAKELILQPEPQIRAVGDVDLELRGTTDSPSLTGQIAIHEAKYTLPAKDKKKGSSGGSAASPSPLSNLSVWRESRMDVSVQWPRNVWYRDGVTSIETAGDVRVQKPQDSSDLLLAGTITSVRGTYNYFGRDFNIETGQIQFTGTPEIDPLINVEASYHSDPTVVYLDVTGTLQRLQLKLRSNPPLSEQDIISVIVFGQPLNELRTRTGGESTNQQMLQAAGGVLGSYVSRGLRQTGIRELDFDVMNIQPTSQGQELTVGRYLTRKLFVSYGQTLRGSAEKSITADYFLTPRWTLEGATDSSQGNHLDFLFRYPVNQRNSATETGAPLHASPFRNSLDQPNPQLPLSHP